MRVGILKKTSPPTSPHPNVMQKEKEKKKMGMMCPIEGGIWGTGIEMHEVMWVQNYKLKIPLCNETGTK